MAIVPRIACLIGLLAAGCATPIESRSWLRVRTPHFELVSGADRSSTLEIAGRLELFRAVLTRFGVGIQLEPRVPLLVYVFGDAADFERFRPRAGVEGFMLPREHRNFLVIHAGEDGMAQTSALHEFVHFVLRNGEATHYPMWYDEGLAELLSTLEVEGSNVLVAQIPPARAAWLRYGSPLALRRMMTATDVYEWSDSALERFYAQAWALMHFFHVSDRAGFDARHAQMLRYIEWINRGLDPEAACAAAFGENFEGLEQDFLLYLGQGSFPYLGIPLADLDVADERDLGPLPEHEKRFLLGDLALALDDRWRGEARRWFELAIEARPEEALAHAALGLALAQEDPRAADAHFATALSLGDADPEAHRLLAEALLERAAAAAPDEATRLVEEARRHFRRSLELAPEQVAGHAGLGRSYLLAPTQGELEEGLLALRTAHERLPADRGVALALAELEVRAGAIEQARMLLARIPAPSHGDPASATESLAMERARRAAGLPASAPLADRHLEARLDVATPPDGEQRRGGSGWVEVTGRGGLSEASLHDVVIAIDESPSTLSPTGTDVDGDGAVGRRMSLSGMHPDSACTDPGDTVIRAELEAARVLVGQLDERTTRVGIVTFAGGTRVLAPLGPPAAAKLALETYEVHVDPTGTSLANALAGSMEELFEHRELGSRRQRTILLLSDGQPTVPSEARGKRDAAELADELGRLGIPVHTFALGKTALEDPEFYRSLAERSGGSFVPVGRPAEIVGRLADVRFTGLQAVEIRNESSGEAGRAVRVFPDGSFDGYVALIEGGNRIGITASVEAGRTLTETRTVFFEHPAEPTPEDRRAADELRKELETRGLELELLAEIKRGRVHSASGLRQLEIGVEREKAAPEPQE